jgi:hypothetical protein
MHVIAFVNIKFVNLALAVCLLVLYDLLLMPIVMFGCLFQALVLCIVLFTVTFSVLFVVIFLLCLC